MTRPNHASGVTLIEMLLVVTIIGLMVGLSFPAASSGIDSIRLLSASDSVVTFLNAALNRAERRQQIMEVTISRRDRKLTLRTTDPNFIREMVLPDTIQITRILPESPQDIDPNAPRRIFLYPGGTVPRIGIELSNQRGTRKIVRVDPVSGVPDVESPSRESK